ncbi:haloacid dehalogenase-like hydrolase [Actinomadura rubteroloni]|uniref:Haloacid dehalogenase-like hydrolase n=1 Tax=Actinomadura rubteroloni TaxID=1926885 RepID=A0A2P4UMU5_9ACTN|nr:HAD-IB family hydrolase [Actinomadura rubteroloni]POM26368.1 haloacid dehalogenase-like hydrolase [Actinomadura rubteroloni]
MIAFFDVDETLISIKSMFSFLEFHLRRRGEPSGTFERIAASLRASAARGVPRDEINRSYYRFLAGERALALADAGRDWFDARDDRLFNPRTVEALRRHRAAGDRIVLLSGSFFPCLDPIAAAVGADWTLGTRPLLRHGRLTGEVLVPMIGAAKGHAARAAAVVVGVPRAACTAYGDHVSDLPLLESVGRPVVVGADPVLTAHARRNGWTRLEPAAA